MHIVVDHPCNESTYEALSRFPPDMTKNILRVTRKILKAIMIAYRKKKRKKIVVERLAFSNKNFLED